MEYRQYENKELPDDKEPRTDQETETGDVLITRVGPRHRVGVACYVEQTRGKLMYSDKIIRCLTEKESALPEYLPLAINSGLSNQFIDDSKSGMAESQMNISQTNLRATPIPVPPLGEQKRIINAVEPLLLNCGALRGQLERMSAIGDNLLSTALERTKPSERTVSK
jgi:type I restriction enzyme S subunit